jgi:alkylation response protein AidB-like acyl-CoA dehydrogenase
MFNMNLTSEQLEFQGMLRNFVANEIKPKAIKPDRLEPFDKPLMLDLLNQTSELGLRSLSLSEETGGVGVDLMTTCIVLEELAVGDVDIAITLGQTALLAGLLFEKWMTKEQRDHYISNFLNDPTFQLAYAGHDPDALVGWNYHEKTQEKHVDIPSATKGVGNWTINGSVNFVTNAPIANLFVVSAWFEDQIIFLLVPKDTPGLKVSEPIITSGENQTRWHHGVMSLVKFDDCQIPDENRINNPENGRDYAERNIIQRAAINLGVGKVAFETAMDYTQIRRQGGVDIIEHQAIGKMIADMSIKLEHSRLMIWKAAWRIDNPNAITDNDGLQLPLHIIASSFTAEAIQEVTHLAAECFGAMAVMRDMPLQKYVEDAFIFLNSDTNDLSTKLRITEAIIDYQR